jgi:hypothetical protein
MTDDRRHNHASHGRTDIHMPKGHNLPEYWLRGPVTDVPVALQPVAHALLQSLEETETALAGLDPADLWVRPGDAASAGFHVLHMAGSLDRLLTYARGEALSVTQSKELAAEANPATVSDTAQLLDLLRSRVQAALAQLRTTDPASLDDARAVGRARLPSSVRGLLCHAGEHTLRHAGQLVTTAKIVRAAPGSRAAAPDSRAAAPDSRAAAPDSRAAAPDSRAATPVATIGYEGATMDRVLAALVQARVEVLVDVRAVASSRRPGFSKTRLAAHLADAGIDYLHLRGLGTPADGRAAARAGRPDEMRRIFDTHLHTAAARDDMDTLADMVGSGRRVCLLCFEADPAHCHRSIVADRLGGIIRVDVDHLRPEIEHADNDPD